MTTIPAVHALHLAEVVRHLGGDRASFLAGVPLRGDSLLDPEARLSLVELAHLVERARAFTGETAIGFYMGLMMRATVHGQLGFAAMTAATVRQAIEVVVRYAPIRTTALALRLDETMREAALVVEERASLGTARDTVLVALLVGFERIARDLTGNERFFTRAELSFPEPTYWRRFAERVSVPVEFDCAEHRFVLARATLRRRIREADPAALRMALELCQRELDRLGERAHLAPRVAALVLRAPSGVRSLPEIAALLGLSQRTLKRRLAEEGTAFHAVRDRRLVEEAKMMLRRSASIDELAARLGYSDPANVSRAFRRWTGESPRRFAPRTSGPPRDRGSRRR